MVYKEINEGFDTTYKIYCNNCGDLLIEFRHEETVIFHRQAKETIYCKSCRESDITKYEERISELEGDLAEANEYADMN